MHAVQKGEDVLFYNSFSGQVMRFRSKGEIAGLVKRLLVRNSLRVNRFTERELRDPEFRQFLDRLRENFMADWIPCSASEGRPVQMYPRVKVMKDERFQRQGGRRRVEDRAAAYLTSLYVYLNDECGQNCRMCGEAFRQFPCCTARRGGTWQADPDDLAAFIEPVRRNEGFMLHLLGGDIFRYAGFSHLCKNLAGLERSIVYYLHYLNATARLAELRKWLAAGSTLRLLVDFPVAGDAFRETLEALGTEDCVNWDFVVRSERDYQEAEQWLLLFPGLHHRIRPFFENANGEFFRKNVFVREEDIAGARPRMKDIYARAVMNPLLFGELTIHPGGGVAATAHTAPLGLLGRDDVRTVIASEMKQNTAWRRIRGHVSPCRDCVFEQLCPPLSGYESAMGRFNLCQIWPDEEATPCGDLEQIG